MTPIKTLIERVEAAAGPDASLDTEIWDFFNPQDPAAPQPPPGFGEPPPGFGRLDPPVTGSVDAILALIGRKLPGHSPGFNPEARGYVMAPAGDDGFRRVTIGRGATIPLSLTIALLKALDAREAAGGSPTDGEGENE